MMISHIGWNDSAEHVSNMTTIKITRIHGDEDTAWPNKVDFSSFKYKPSCTSWQSRENGENLLGHHWQYFNVDTIELIKTAPCSCLQCEILRKYKKQ